jgi:hypothetical protein
MASPDESPLRALITSWPAFAAMAVTVLSFLAARPNLDSPRPTSVSVSPKEEFRGGDVQIRLWQDPLGSVLNGPFQDDKKNLLNGMPPAAAGTPGADKVLVLLVQVEMDMTPEQIETRRRERFATLAALNTAGYVPVKSERISYLDFVHKPGAIAAGRYVPKAPSKNVMPQLWSKPIQQAAPKAAPKESKGPAKDSGHPREESRLRIAFEWHRPLDGSEMIKNASGEPRYRGVCVVWVWDDIEPGNGVTSLRVLKDEIQTILRPLGTGPACEFAITGRISSARLADIRKDDYHAEAVTRSGEGLTDVVLYVTNSTARSARGGKGDERLPKSRLRLRYVIGSDDLLLAALIGELENRRVSVHHEPIALISEWDSAYGRAMHQEFLKAAGFVDASGGVPYEPSNVYLYSYLRGLDGKLPVKSEAAGEGDKPASKESKPADSATADRPGAAAGEGDAQVDYLSRLVERMHARRKPFRAIGVLGSDPYDKLLILRAVRSSFSQAVTFTTDLDVRLLQPGEFAATRNLVIASHFGWMLDKSLQQKIPPFRSSYDTASYLGCLLAVGCPLLNGRGTDPVTARSGAVHNPMPLHTLHLTNREAAPLPVHLYEVGRYGAFELTSYTAEEDPLGARNYLRDREYFTNNWWRLLIVPLCALLLGLLLVTVSRSWQRMLHLHSRTRHADEPELHAPWRGGLFVLSAIVVSLLVAAILYSHYHPHHEPFSMVDGLSLWPTIVFRVFAIGLCVYYLCKTLEDLAKQDWELRKDFGFPAPHPRGAQTRSLRYRCKALLHGTIGMWLWSPEAEEKTAPVVWRRFERFGSSGMRLWRSLMVLVLNVALFLLLYSLADTIAFRGRGGLAWWTGRISLDLAALALVFLLIFVVDSTVLCYRFVTYVGRCRCDWSAALLGRYAEERGLSLADGSGNSARAAITELLRIRLIADATSVPSRLIFDPFVVLAVLVVAQSPLFVPWQWNIPILTVAFLTASAALACAVILQRAAQQARSRALETMDRILLPLAPADSRREKLTQVRAEIADRDTGVFSGLAQNPVVYALLLPLCGGSGLAAIEALLSH